MKDPILRGSIPNREYFLLVVKYCLLYFQFQYVCSVFTLCDTFSRINVKEKFLYTFWMFAHFIAMNTLFVDCQMLRNTFCDSNK